MKIKKRSDAFLINTAAEIRTIPAEEANSIVYIPRLLANISLPVRQIDGNEYIRRNGRHSLHILSPTDIGLPYGTYPRLLIIHITTLAKITCKDEIYLGDSLSHFVKSLGKSCSGGINGTLRALKEQSKRLLASTLIWQDTSQSSWRIEAIRIAQVASVFWDPHKPKNWESHLKLDSRFYNDVQHYAVPVDWRVLDVCSHYPLAMDIYCWLTHRVYRMPNPTMITWEQLSVQFGNKYGRKSHFKERYILALKRVSMFYPNAKYSIEKNGLLLFPSPPHIKPKSA